MMDLIYTAYTILQYGPIVLGTVGGPGTFDSWSIGYPAKLELLKPRLQRYSGPWATETLTGEIPRPPCRIQGYSCWSPELGDLLLDPSGDLRCGRMLKNTANALRTLTKLAEARAPVETGRQTIITTARSQAQGVPRLPNAPLSRALWSLFDANWGVLKGSWGMPVQF